MLFVFKDFTICCWVFILVHNPTTITTLSIQDKLEHKPHHCGQTNLFPPFHLPQMIHSDSRNSSTNAMIPTNTHTSHMVMLLLLLLQLRVSIHRVLSTHCVGDLNTLAATEALWNISNLLDPHDHRNTQRANGNTNQSKKVAEQNNICEALVSLLSCFPPSVYPSRLINFSHVNQTLQNSFLHCCTHSISLLSNTNSPRNGS